MREKTSEWVEFKRRLEGARRLQATLVTMRSVQLYLATLRQCHTEPDPLAQADAIINLGKLIAI